MKQQQSCGGIKMPEVSVIIPCYNHGIFIDDAVQSVLNQTYQDFEIIIVNDGSTDEQTIRILNGYSHPKIKVINMSNKGASQARNTGIEKSSGKYILPLDADDKIEKSYIEKSIRILNENQKTGIVYCKAAFWGSRNGDWILPEYSLSRILIVNCIFVSAMYRKKDWETAGGYNAVMSYGYEDWDFWLSLIENGAEVCRLPETMFFYRQHEDLSRNANLIFNLSKSLFTCLQIFKNHKKLYFKNPSKIILLFGYHFYVWIRQIILQIIKIK